MNNRIRFTQDPTQQRAWQALRPDLQLALTEAAEWVISPITLAKFDSPPDIPKHPNDMSASDALGELIRRAYEAAGAADIPLRHTALTRLKHDRTAPDEITARVELFIKAASVTAERNLQNSQQR